MSGDFQKNPSKTHFQRNDCPPIIDEFDLESAGNPNLILASFFICFVFIN